MHQKMTPGNNSEDIMQDTCCLTFEKTDMFAEGECGVDLPGVCISVSVKYSETRLR